MKKLWKTIGCIVCACLFILPLAACNMDEKPREQTLKITVSNLGFGTAWLDAVAEEFEKLYDVDVQVSKTVIQKDLLLQLDNDYQLDDLCMFAGVDKAWDTMRRGKFMQIDDIWDTTVEGETLSIKEKMIPEYREAYKFNDHYYSLPFITELGGFAYNATTLDSLFGKGNWSLPKTTFELDSLGDRIKETGRAYTFTWCNKENACYWEMPGEAWKAQYNGKEVYDNMHRARVYDADARDYVLDTNGKMLELKGQLRMFETVRNYVYKENGYSHKYCTSMQFAESQAAFAGIPYANDNKLVAFTPNGNWLYEENLEDFEYKNQDIGFMRVPVISSLVEKLSFYDETADYAALGKEKKTAYDAALVAIVDYVDGTVSAAPTVVGELTVTADDVERVREARNVAYMKDQAHAFIPHNSVNAELAKKFLVFLCSDYAGEIYSSATHGFMPTYAKVTESNAPYLSRFDKDVANILNTSTAIVTTDSRYNFRLQSATLEDFFNTGKTYYGTPQETFAWYKKINGDNWQDKLRVAGLLPA